MTLSNSLKSRWVTVAVLAAAVTALLTGAIARLWSAYDRRGPVREVVVPAGVGAAGVARILEDEGVIRHRIAFAAYAWLTGKAGRLQAGTYLLCPCQTVPSLVNAIAGGDALPDDIRLTIPEGTNVWGLDALLLRLDITTRAGQFSGAYHDREGKLFPETYRLDKEVTSEEVADRLSQEFADRAGRYTPEQVIVASILEREAKTPEDMALIAGVIEERMTRGIALQIDATVAYGWCVRTAGFARACDVTQAPISSEIRVDGPYNTYTRTRLPIGPISNPGSQALYAAAHPRTSEYLYYLSTRDGSEIIYSRTLDEHLENRAKYLGL